MNAAPSVQAEALTRRFGNFCAVDAIDFTIGAGEIWASGPNGSGKSTTIRMLCGVLPPTSGRAIVLGYDVARDPEAVKLRIGYMTQGSSLWNDLTVEEHLRLYAGLFGMYGREQRSVVETWMSAHRSHAVSRRTGGRVAGRYAQASGLGVRRAAPSANALFG